MVYLAIATVTTTHSMLSPFIFIVIHFYMLLNLVLLARTAKSFEDTLQRAFPKKDPDDAGRENFCMRIENTMFVQLLVGAKREREGINAKLLSLMALITLALTPVALLLLIQIKFLPYHSEPITWWHRGLLAVDLVLVWTLWPGYRSGWGVRLWPKKRLSLVGSSVLSAGALSYWWRHFPMSTCIWQPTGCLGSLWSRRIG